MDPSSCSCLPFSSRLPRVSGDGPQLRTTLTKGARAAPRERGWTSNTPKADDLRTGCPA